MPRFFKPVGGSTSVPGTIKAVRINEDGDTHTILADGTERRTGFVGPDSRWMPDRTIEEMENLVRGGSWMEVKDADAEIGELPISPNAAPRGQTAQPQSPPAQPALAAAKAASTRSTPAPPPADTTNQPPQSGEAQK